MKVTLYHMSTFCWYIYIHTLYFRAQKKTKQMFEAFFYICQLYQHFI